MEDNLLELLKIYNILRASDSLTKHNATTINIKAFKERETVIESLRKAKHLIADTANMINNMMEVYEEARDMELAAVATLTPANRNQAIIKHEQNIKITNSLSVRAKKVNNFDNVKQDGSLYYIPKYNHFAIKISGILCHGNIGAIFYMEKNPTKIKDCKFGIECTKYDQCSYYHDPLTCPKSTDIRNYVAHSWVYSDPLGRNNTLSRHYGALQHLDTDLLTITKMDVDKLNNQIMHDILCLVVATNTMRELES